MIPAGRRGYPDSHPIVIHPGRDRLRPGPARRVAPAAPGPGVIPRVAEPPRRPLA